MNNNISGYKNLTLLFFWSCIIAGCKSMRDASISRIEAACNEVRTINGICFSPDMKKLYTAYDIDSLRQRGKFNLRIFEWTLKKRKYINSVRLDFSKTNSVDYRPVGTYDGSTLFFNSYRPAPGDTGLRKKQDIWYVNRSKNDWGDPQYLTQINTKEYAESYPAISSAGNLYFTSERPGGKGGRDIYVSELRDGSYQAPVNVTELNSPDDENDIAIDPDEKIMILNRYIFSTKEIDMFVSVRENGRWNQPTLIEPLSKKGVWELSPAFVPGKKLIAYEVGMKIKFFSIDSLKLLH